MIIRYDFPIENIDPKPEMAYFIKDECFYAYDSSNFFTHSIAEICYVLTGRGRLKVNNEVYPLESRSLYVINPYVNHCEYLNRNTSDGFTYFIVGVRNFKLLSNGESAVHVPKLLPPGDNISYLLQGIFRELSGQLTKHTEAAKKYFELLIVELERKYSGKIEKSSYIVNNFAVQIKDFLDVNYAGDVSSKTVAEYFGKKLNTVEVRFKKTFGISIQSYILTKRIDGAKRMIESNHNIPIGELAAKMGFYNPTYFSKYFKKITGVSPTEYKAAIIEKSLNN